MSQIAISTSRNFALEARIKAHLNATASPETCPGLCRTPPPKRQDFTKIFTFHLNALKRPDRSMAPCPVCSPNAPKYFSGVLAWFPLEQVYRCIGRECAGHYIGHAQAVAAEREFKARTQENENLTFAFDNLGNVPAITHYMERLLIVCTSAETAIRLVGRSQVRGLLYNSVKANNGWLRLWSTVQTEKTDMSGRAVTVNDTVPEDLGLLAGWSALGPHFRAAKEIRIELERLKALNRGDQDAAQSWVIEQGSSFGEDLRIFRNSIARTYDVKRKALQFANEARNFFTPQNFVLITKFGSDKRNGHPFFAAHLNGVFQIGESRFHTVRLRANFADDLNSLPEWPEIARTDDS